MLARVWEVRYVLVSAWEVESVGRWERAAVVVMPVREFEVVLIAESVLSGVRKETL
jgi:hypothetical protein